MVEEQPQHAITRRTVIAGGATASFFALLDVLGIQIQAPRASADPLPSSAADMASLALSLQGKTLAQLQGSVMMAPHYGDYEGDWCAVFAAWLTRSVVPWRSGYSYAKTLYESQQSVSTPQVGDFIYYQGTGVQHIGVVVDTSNGVRTVEGNTHKSPWNVAVVTSYHPPWNTPTASKYYSRPDWASAPAPTTPTSPPSPQYQIEEEAVYIQAISNGSSGYAVNGYIYANDIGGHWRGLTNLEGTGYVTPLSNQGRVNLLQFYGSDIELLFAVNGLWEQVPLGASAPTWSSGQQLIGLGNLTGRLIYPGASGLQGTWHYPADEHA